ncbi:unnamed protein product [Somion occarium]
MNAPGYLSDVPALMPSSLGYHSKGHRAHHSISSSSNSSVVWSAVSDDEDESQTRIAIEGELALNADCMGDAGSIRSTTSALGSALKSNSGLSYARRPSATNHRSTIPILHRRLSSTSNQPMASFSSTRSGSLADYSAEEDFSDVPSGSVSSSVASSVRSRKDTMRPASFVDALETDQNSALKRKRDRTSLPACFSLLQMSPSAGSPASKQSSRSPRSPASLQTLNAISRSLHSTPTTPRTANPLVDHTSAIAEPSTRTEAVEPTTRGRSRRRDPDGRSASSRRSQARSPPRHLAQHPHTQTSSTCPHHRVTLGAEARARLDSVEKVADWVASSPVVRIPNTSTRRNSSPPPLPKYELMRGAGFPGVADLYARSLQYAVDTDDEEVAVKESVETRGRRRANELDAAPIGVRAPGFGNGRSGLKAREDRVGREDIRRGRW